MDTSALVESGQKLVTLLDEAGKPPRAAIWVVDPERENWRLWIVPFGKDIKKHEFYQQVSSLLVHHKADFAGLDIADIDLRPADHPAIKGLHKVIHAEGLSNIQFTHNTFNGFYLPDCIVLRLAL